MQDLIVLSLCNTYSYPLVFSLCSFFAGRGIFRRFPTFPDLGKLKKVCDQADACQRGGGARLPSHEKRVPIWYSF